MYEIKTEDIYEDFSKDKEMSRSSNYSAEWKCYGDSNGLVVGKMKDEAGDVAIKEFVGLKPKMYSFLVDDNSEHKMQRVWIKIFMQQLMIRNTKMLNQKHLRHSMNRIESINHRIGTHDYDSFNYFKFWSN